MKQYQQLLRHVLAHGSEHEDRTGVGTVSAFGYQTRYDLREGFPIVTTKRVPFRWVAEELFWFLSGDTNEANLRARGVDIWKEWADLEHTSRFGREEGDLGPVFYEQKRLCMNECRILSLFWIPAFYAKLIHSFPGIHKSSFRNYKLSPEDD